jgi:predicted HAD superfamily phosphohydrolase YqeG
MNQDIYIYVDIDDTIVRSVGTKRIPIPTVIQHVKELKQQGAVMYCWSSGGKDYARQSAEEFGIADCFAAFLPKPNILLDDCSMANWPRFICIHPSTCSGKTLDEYKRELNPK